MKRELIVVGAGLSGLLTAYLLRDRYRITLLEARPRIGGRILTFEADGARYDLGPTWVWPHQHHVLQLAESLGVTLFRHYDRGAFAYDAPGGVQYFRAPQNAPSYRIEGGAAALTEALLQRLDGVALHLDSAVETITSDDDGVIVVSGNRHFRADRCVVTLPPRLAAAVAYDPPLAASMKAEMDAVPTWMGFSSKCIVTYPEPFWRERGLSGFATSHLGPLSEIHDASAHSKGALFGFYRSADADEAQPDRVVEQLARLFGPEAYDYGIFRYHNWRRDPYTSTPADREPLREHPRYGLGIVPSPRVHFCGTETSASEGGYLEGAVIAATELAGKLLA